MQEIQQLTASFDANCAQIRNLAAANNGLQERRSKLNAIEIAKPKTVPLDYTLPDKKSGTIQVDFDSGVILFSEIEDDSLR